VGIVVGALGVIVLRPNTAEPVAFGPRAAWKASDRAVSKLFGCGERATGTVKETSCAIRTMAANGASRDAQDFFRATHWFMTGFRESGMVDVGSVFVPWRANSNDDYLLLNGSPAIVAAEAEAPDVALFGQDAAYEPLRGSVKSDDLVLWTTDETFESVQRSASRTRFIFQWSLNDGCHACATGYLARAALEFAPDGTYLGPAALNICWGTGNAKDLSRVVDAPDCPPVERIPEG
jgi:hypothetical protein